MDVFGGCKTVVLNFIRAALISTGIASGLPSGVAAASHAEFDRVTTATDSVRQRLIARDAALGDSAIFTGVPEEVVQWPNWPNWPNWNNWNNWNNYWRNW